MRRARGYTIIEVMMALALLAVGTSGIIAMQKVTSVNNRDSKNLVIAGQIARTWMERLRADAVQWNHPSANRADDDLADTTWIKNHITGTWFRPDYDANRGSPTFDVFGNDVDDTKAAADGVYCTNIRLSWLYGPPPDPPPPYLIRAEIRVYWLRDGAGGPVGGTGVCDKTFTNFDAISPAVDRYHFVYVTSAIQENMAM